MRRSALKTGLAALALVLLSQAAAASSTLKNADGLSAAGQVQSSPEEIVKIRQFLAVEKNLTKMKLPRLQQRLHRAEAFREVKGLPAEIDQALQDEIARITLEITRRGMPAGEPQLENPPLPPAVEPQLEDPPLPPAVEPQLEDPPLPPYNPQ